jgi:hypothetical protein
MELTQILLFAVVGILTILLVAVGVQVMIILFQFKKTVNKLDKFLEDANVISQSVARPMAGVNNFLEGLKSMKSLVEIVSEKQREVVKPVAHNHQAHQHVHQVHQQTPTAMETIQQVLDKTPIAPIVEELREDVAEVREIVAEMPEQIQHTHIHAIQERGRRFFHKSGKPLTS